MASTSSNEDCVRRFFEGKRVLITGASMGIGHQLVLRVARYKDIKLAVIARSFDKLQELATTCHKQNPSCQVLPIRCDVTEPKQCKEAVDAAVKQFGGLDVLILNAGISASIRFEDIEDISLFNKLISTNLLGYVYMTKFALPHLKSSNVGPFSVIAATSSMSGKLGVPLRTAYCASKYGVQGFFESLRNELGSDSRVKICLMCPGWVDTEIRSRHLHNQHSSSQYDKSKMLPIQDCVEGIVIAIAKGEREKYFSLKHRLYTMLNTVAPAVVDKQLRKYIGVSNKSAPPPPHLRSKM